MPKKIETPAIKLSLEDKKKLEALQVDIEKGEKAVKALKELDIDVKGIEEKIEWAKKAREVLLTEFV
jgi:saccharopine dehydrogenase-like NADP-dependent oxidoreductase